MIEQEQNRIFHQWMEEHRGLLFRIVRAYSRDADDGQDLFQEIALQLWNSVPTYRGSCASTTWIYRVAFFVAMRWSTRENKRIARQAPFGEEHLGLLDSAPREDPLLERLYDEIGRLNALDRTLTLLLLDGYEYKEIGEILGLSVNHVGVKLNRIKKHIVEHIGGRS